MRPRGRTPDEWGRRAVAVALFGLVVVSVIVAAASGGYGVAGTERTTYQSIVVFRNDDVQPYYRTEALAAVSGVFAQEDVPLTHGVIPYAGSAPITAGPEVCPYLRELRDRRGGSVEFAVHGYAHRPATDFFERSEFGGRPLAEQRSMVREGTAVVRSCTGTTPRTFIAPYNTYDSATVDALADAGYVTVSGGPYFTQWYFDRAGPFKAGGLVHVPNTEGFVANWTTQAFYDRETLRTAFDAAYANQSVYVQMLHHPTFTTGPNESTVSERKVDRLRSFVRYVEGHDVAIMTLGDFGEAYASGRLQRTTDGWVLTEEDPSSEWNPLPFSGTVGVATPRHPAEDRAPSLAAGIRPPATPNFHDR